MTASGAAGPSRRRRLVVASIVLGVGLGGFFDGIVFHQLLQWHHMVSTPTPPDTVANLELNTFFDGLFHATTWLITLAGIWMLLFTDGERHRPGGSRVLGGGLLAGWGGFNLVEGVIDHYVLKIHHVRAGPDEGLYDLAFLLWGAVFLIAGWSLIRSAMRRGAATSSPTGPASVRR
jgi:uncharacterized membrane protein